LTIDCYVIAIAWQAAMDELRREKETELEELNIDHQKKVEKLQKQVKQLKEAHMKLMEQIE
jgi:uncharacterized protein YlxW (UPF0749 family)